MNIRGLNRPNVSENRFATYPDVKPPKTNNIIAHHLPPLPEVSSVGHWRPVLRLSPAALAFTFILPSLT